MNLQVDGKLKFICSSTIVETSTELDVVVMVVCITEIKKIKYDQIL